MKFHGSEFMVSIRMPFMYGLRSDLFTRIVATIVILGAFSSPAFAALDLSVGSTARSYPLSGVIEAETGYGVLLYGSNTAAPWYGYLRPRILGSSALSYNSLDGAVELFPVSFLGARAGGEAIQNDKEYTPYDCVIYTCLGRFYRTYFEAELTIGAKGFFAQAAWRRERWSQKTPAPTEFIDPTSGYSLAGHGDSQTVYRGVLGYKFSPRWSSLAILRYSESEETKMISRFPYLVVRYSVGNFSAGVGGGVFESSLKKQEGTGVAFIRWDIQPSVGLR